MSPCHIIVTGDEFGEYADIRELRKRAIAYYARALQGSSTENASISAVDRDGNGTIEFTGEGKGKIKSNSAREDTLLLIRHLPQIIGSAKKAEGKEAASDKHKKTNDYFYYLHTYYVRGGELIPLDITLKKLHTGQIHYYNHTVGKRKNAPVNSGN